MRRVSWKWPVAVFIASVSAACSAILGLDPPPVPDAGAGGGGDMRDAPVIPTPDATPPTPPVCAALDAGSGDAGEVYFSLTPLALDDAGAGPWEVFDTDQIKQKSFAGGTFDGQYVYFAARDSVPARYDTHLPFGDVAAWTTFDVSSAPLHFTGGFAGAVFDERYVYFIPYEVGSKPASEVVRYDTLAGSFTDPAAWAAFDTAALSVDGGAAAGFFGAGFDGRFLYLVPRSNGAADGRVVRYDTASDADKDDAGESDAGESDAGDAGESDAGDAGESDAGESDAGESNPGFSNPASWSTFDLATLNPLAVGYAGAVFDGTAIYLAPQQNFALGDVVHGGANSLVTRMGADGGFTAASWSTFDVTSVQGFAANFIGAGFDGRYVYFAPHQFGVVVRYDTTAGELDAGSAWSAYDLTHVITTDAAATSFTGAAFDGRFVYFIPSGAGFGTLVRYDTLSTFTADCAWSTADLTQLDATSPDGGSLPTSNYQGAVFDGAYLYLIPDGTGAALRFRARAPGSPLGLPAFHGSFF
jgi:hypothetical protein